MVGFEFSNYMDHWSKRRRKSWKRKEWNFLFSFRHIPGDLSPSPEYLQYAEWRECSSGGSLFSSLCALPLGGREPWMRCPAFPHLHTGTNHDHEQESSNKTGERNRWRIVWFFFLGLVLFCFGEGCCRGQPGRHKRIQVPKRKGPRS